MDPTQNDSFGSFSSGQGGYIGQPGAYSAAPIAVSDGRKKSKKWVWILVLVIFVAVAGGIFALWQSGTFDNKDYIGLVNKYLNLLVSNNDSEGIFDDELSVEYLTNNSNEKTQNIYTLPRMLDYDDNNNKSYYNSLVSILDEINSIKKTRGDRETIASIANYSKELLSRYYISTILTDTDASYDYFIKHKTLDGFLSAYGYPFDELNEGLINDYSNTIKELVEIKGKMYSAILNANCLDVTGINYECVGQLDSKEIDDYRLNNSNLNMMVNEISSTTLYLIMVDANQMRSIINGENNE